MKNINTEPSKPAKSGQNCRVARTSWSALAFLKPETITLCESWEICDPEGLIGSPLVRCKLCNKTI